jgi:hypothetical protein
MNDIMTKERHKVHHTLKGARQAADPIGWKRTVKVWAIGNDPIHWHLESSLVDPLTNYLVFNKANDQMPKRDYYVIDFSLQDHSGLNLRFKPNPMKAFAVAIGSDQPPPPDCPGQGSYSDSIYAICCDQNGKTLTVRNDDMNTEYFSFSLYFDSDDGDQRCDPGGDNQNGNFVYEY